MVWLVAITEVERVVAHLSIHAEVGHPLMDHNILDYHPEDDEDHDNNDMHDSYK